MKVFVDTSGLYAMFVVDDAQHAHAAAAFARLLEARAELGTTSYILVETVALLHRRVGSAAVRALAESIQPRCSRSGGSARPNTLRACEPRSKAGMPARASWIR